MSDVFRRGRTNRGKLKVCKGQTRVMNGLSFLHTSLLWCHLGNYVPGLTIETRKQRVSNFQVDELTRHRSTLNANLHNVAFSINISLLSVSVELTAPEKFSREINWQAWHMASGNVSYLLMTALAPRRLVTINTLAPRPTISAEPVPAGLPVRADAQGGWS